MTEAATFAQDKLEELRATPYIMIANSTDTTGGSTGIPYTRNWNVVESGNLKTVTVTINWTDQISHTVTLVSVISQ